MGALCFKGAEEAARGSTAAAAAGLEHLQSTSANGIPRSAVPARLAAGLATNALKGKPKHARGLALVDSSELAALLHGLSNPAVVLCISRQDAMPDTGVFDTATSLLTSTGRERITERPRLVLDGPCGQPCLALPLHIDSAAALTCLAINQCAEAGMRLHHDQDVLGLLAAQCVRDPSLQALLRDVVKRLLLGGRCSAVSHLAPTWGGGGVACATDGAAAAAAPGAAAAGSEAAGGGGGAAGGGGRIAATQEQHFQSLRLTPLMCRLAALDTSLGDGNGLPAPASKHARDGSAEAATEYAAAMDAGAAVGAAAASSSIRSGPVVPALILELGVPYEGKDLALRLQRDYMVLSNIPSIVTMFDLSGRVLHQNRSSIQYLGYLAGMDQQEEEGEDTGQGGGKGGGAGGGDTDADGHEHGDVEHTAAGRRAGGGGGGRVNGEGGGGGQQQQQQQQQQQRNWLQQLFVLDAGRLQELLEAVAAGAEWRGLVQMPHGSFWQQCDMLPPQQQPHTPRGQHQQNQSQVGTLQEPFGRAVLGAGTSTYDLGVSGAYRLGAPVLPGRGSRTSVDASYAGRTFARSGTSHSDGALTRIMAGGVSVVGATVLSPRQRAATEPTQRAEVGGPNRATTSGMGGPGGGHGGGSTAAEGGTPRHLQNSGSGAALRRVSQALFGEGLVVAGSGLSATEGPRAAAAAAAAVAAYGDDTAGGEAVNVTGYASMLGTTKVSVSDWATSTVAASLQGGAGVGVGGAGAAAGGLAAAADGRSSMPSAFTHLAATMLAEYPVIGAGAGAGGDTPPPPPPPQQQQQQQAASLAVACHLPPAADEAAAAGGDQKSPPVSPACGVRLPAQLQQQQQLQQPQPLSPPQPQEHASSGSADNTGDVWRDVAAPVPGDQVPAMGLDAAAAAVAVVPSAAAVAVAAAGTTPASEPAARIGTGGLLQRRQSSIARKAVGAGPSRFQAAAAAAVAGQRGRTSLEEAADGQQQAAAVDRTAAQVQPPSGSQPAKDPSLADQQQQQPPWQGTAKDGEAAAALAVDDVAAVTAATAGGVAAPAAAPPAPSLPVQDTPPPLLGQQLQPCGRHSGTGCAAATDAHLPTGVPTGNSSFQQWYAPAAAGGGGGGGGGADAARAPPDFAHCYPPLPAFPPPPPLPVIQSASISSSSLSPATALSSAVAVPAQHQNHQQQQQQQQQQQNQSQNQSVPAAARQLSPLPQMPSTAPPSLQQQQQQHSGRNSSIDRGSSMFSDMVPSVNLMMMMMDRSSVDPGSEINTALFTNDITHDPALLQRQFTHQNSHSASHSSRARASLRSGPRSSRGSGSAFASPASTAVAAAGHGYSGRGGGGGGYGSLVQGASPPGSGSGGAVVAGTLAGAAPSAAAAAEASASGMPPPSLAQSADASGSTTGSMGLGVRVSSEDSGVKVTGGGQAASRSSAESAPPPAGGTLAEAVRVVNSMAWGALPPVGGMGAAMMGVGGDDAGPLSAVGRSMLPAVIESPMPYDLTADNHSRTNSSPSALGNGRPHLEQQQQHPHQQQVDHQQQQPQHVFVLPQDLLSANSTVGTPTTAGATSTTASAGRAPPRNRFTPTQQQFAMMARGHPLSLGSSNTNGGSISRRHQHAYGMEQGEANGPDSGNPETLSYLATTTDVAFSIDLLVNNAFPTAITANASPATTVAANTLQQAAGSCTQLGQQQQLQQPVAQQLQPYGSAPSQGVQQQSLQRTLSSEACCLPMPAPSRTSHPSSAPSSMDAAAPQTRPQEAGQERLRQEGITGHPQGIGAVHGGRSQGTEGPNVTASQPPATATTATATAAAAATTSSPATAPPGHGDQAVLGLLLLPHRQGLMGGSAVCVGRSGQLLEGGLSEEDQRPVFTAADLVQAPVSEAPSLVHNSAHLPALLQPHQHQHQHQHQQEQPQHEDLDVPLAALAQLRIPRQAPVVRPSNNAWGPPPLRARGAQAVHDGSTVQVAAATPTHDSSSGGSSSGGSATCPPVLLASRSNPLPGFSVGLAAKGGLSSMPLQRPAMPSDGSKAQAELLPFTGSAAAGAPQTCSAAPLLLLPMARSEEAPVGTGAVAGGQGEGAAPGPRGHGAEALAAAAAADDDEAAGPTAAPVLRARQQPTVITAAAAAAAAAPALLAASVSAPIVPSPAAAAAAHPAAAHSRQKLTTYIHASHAEDRRLRGLLAAYGSNSGGLSAASRAGSPMLLGAGAAAVGSTGAGVGVSSGVGNGRAATSAASFNRSSLQMTLQQQQHPVSPPAAAPVPLPQSATAAAAAWQQQQRQQQQQRLALGQSADGSGGPGRLGPGPVGRAVSEAAAAGGYLPLLPVDVAAAAARERAAAGAAAGAAAHATGGPVGVSRTPSSQPLPPSLLRPPALMVVQPMPLSPQQWAAAHHPQRQHLNRLPSLHSVAGPYCTGASIGPGGGSVSHTGMASAASGGVRGGGGGMQPHPSSAMSRGLSGGHSGTALVALATAPTGPLPPASMCPSNPVPGSTLGASFGEGGSCSRWFEVHAIPVPDPSSTSSTGIGVGSAAAQQQQQQQHDHHGTLIMVIMTDVTSKVHAEERLARVLEAEHRLLADIFPSHVVRHMTQLRRDEAELERKGMVLLKNIQDPAALATSHECITVLFADIKGFTDMSKEVPAATVMTFLNDLYTRFDSLTDVYGVYKVETIGDCYMVAGGLVARDEDGYGRAVRGQGDVDPLHAMRVVAFARAMLDEAANVMLPTTGEPVKMRVGIHSGPATSGVVGHKMPRFCLFGDTVNTASRMESTGRPGVIHASAVTRGLLPPEEDEEGWAPTGGVDVKGKGFIETFIWCTKAPGAERRQRSRYQRAQLLGTLSSLAPPLASAVASVGGASAASQGAASPAVGGGAALPATPSTAGAGAGGGAYGPSASALLSPRRATRREDRVSLMRTYTHGSNNFILRE